MIREATAEDMPRIRELQKQTDAKCGMQMDIPDAEDRAILGYWVVIENGVIEEAFYAEMGIEFVQVGTNPRCASEVWRFKQQVFNAAAHKGARYLHCFIPPALDSWLGRMLFRVTLFLMSGTAGVIGKYLYMSGFRKTGFIHYNRRLR